MMCMLDVMWIMSIPYNIACCRRLTYGGNVQAIDDMHAVDEMHTVPGVHTVDDVNSWMK
jgi:hypothetical protein